MYIANCTQQVQDFIYRLPETPGPRSQRIDIGSQVQISGDLSTPDIDAIVRQHATYGLVSVDEVDRTKPFVGLCYSVDKPVPVAKIKSAIAHNYDVMVERGKELRKEAAVATESSLVERGAGPAALEMSVVEETKDGSDPTFNEGLRVTRNEAPSEPPRRGNRNNRRAA
jgi:hypothetical protein